MSAFPRWIFLLPLATGLMIGNPAAATAAMPNKKAFKPPQWTDYPLILRQRAGREGSFMRPFGIDGEQLQIYASSEAGEPVANWSVDVEQGKGTLKTRSGTLGSYHWVSTIEEDDALTRQASTLVSFSNPGPAPRSMLDTDKGALEIRPLLLPREHQYYRAGEAWPFRVLYQGKPAAGVPVRFESSRGSSADLVTDEQGLFSLVFPDDFPPPEEHAHSGHHRRVKTDFVLAVKLRRDERLWETSFNYVYTPHAFSEKNLWLGTGFAIFGMVAAAPLLRTRKKAKGAKR